MSGFWWWGTLGGSFLFVIGVIAWVMVRICIALLKSISGHPHKAKSRTQEPIVVCDDSISFFDENARLPPVRLEISVSIGGDDSLDKAIAYVTALKKIAEKSKQGT